VANLVQRLALDWQFPINLQSLVSARYWTLGPTGLREDAKAVLNADLIPPTAWVSSPGCSG
jgi:hypothetical protein